MIKFLTVALCTLAVQAGVKVLHPKELKVKLGNDGVIASSLANFGHVVYGTSVVSKLNLILLIARKDILSIE